MSEQEWIVSKEAARRARQAGCSEGDLAQWAEAGSLRSRAGRGRFSDDDEGVERMLELPQSSEERDKETTKRVTLGEPWPDIPSDFWHWLNIRSQASETYWAAGVFATVVYNDSNLGPNTDSQHIKLLDVTFHAGDLEKLLKVVEVRPSRGILPASAKPNDRKYEERAHLAAEIIRTDGVTLAAAIRRVVDHKKSLDIGEPKSRERALRIAFGLMYTPNGLPHQKRSRLIFRQQ